MGQCGSAHSGHYGQLSRDTARKKALLVGVNYGGTRAPLRGCINDVNNIKEVIKVHYGFQDSDIMVLSEDEPKDKWPNKSAIMDGFRWLYEGMQAGELCYFHYSGHGSHCQIRGQKETAECICPLDCLDKPWPDAVITDVEINRALFSPLGSAVKSVAVFDCCHSGKIANLKTVRNLSWIPQLGSEPEARSRFLQPPPGHIAPASSSPTSRKSIRGSLLSGTHVDHELWVLSGCQDDQTSADAFEQGQYQGAFTWAMITALTKDVWHQTYYDLLAQIKDNLKHKYAQIPALATSHSEYLNWFFLGKGHDHSKSIEDAAPGRKKALLVGCNYRGSRFELQGCINDVVNQKKMLQERYGFKECDMLILTEDEVKANWPYKKRIQEGLEWLVDGVRANDHLFFHFSGHGSQITDRSGTEADGRSEVICPLDIDHDFEAHVIVDTEIHTDLYDKLPNGVRLECIFDCCHSGSVANVPNTKVLVPMVPQEYNKERYLPPPEAYSQPGSPSSPVVAAFTCGRPAAAKRACGFRKATQAAGLYKDKMLWVYSGCHDNQTSADAFEDGMPQGAFTWAFLKALKHSDYCARHGDLILKIREVLTPHYPQVPAVSTTNAALFGRHFQGQATPLSRGFTPSGASCGR